MGGLGGAACKGQGIRGDARFEIWPTSHCAPPSDGLIFDHLAQTHLAGRIFRSLKFTGLEPGLVPW
jgi:hypothetical protein